MKNSVHLICNSHIDPIWHWYWEEGAAVAMATFRTSADLCEEFSGFIFNHNEAILYQWIEEHEPALFVRIQKLVKAGKWQIIGGWYLQPDCNMPAGETIIRQMLVGRTYFREKFGVCPTTAINFDSFGHARGMVQLMAKSGYDSYIHWRPEQKVTGQSANEHRWIGYDGSEILVVRDPTGYGSNLGEAAKKVEDHLKTKTKSAVSLLLWGVGDHGGGPSRKDIRDLDGLIASEKKAGIRHSTPEAYITDLRRSGKTLPRWEQGINYFGVGCYTSMVRIKQGYRALENELYLTEKMATAAAMQGLLTYPREELKEAEKDLLLTAFHDVLPGSTTPSVEESCLRLIGHGRELLARARARAFFALAAHQPKACPDTYPVLVYNPHPWAVETTLTCDLSLPDVIFCPNAFFTPKLKYQGVALPIQPELPDVNYPIDWSRKVVFRALLEPGKMNRFDVVLDRLPKRPILPNLEKGGAIRLCTQDLDWAIDSKTGLLRHLRIKGKNLLKKGAFAALVMRDTPDPWSMGVDTFENCLGRFTALSPAKCAELAGIEGKRLKAVRVVEDGPVRTVVEALFGYKQSSLVMTWKIPKRGTDIELDVRVFWNEKDKMLKLAIPSMLRDSEYAGQVLSGREPLATTGREVLAQRWTAMISRRDNLAFTCINAGTYGSSFSHGEMRLTLLRSPAYTALCIGDWPNMPKDRFRPRIDQGERLFSFLFNGGFVKERLAAIENEAMVYNEKPVTLWHSPPETGKPLSSALTLSNTQVQLQTFKQTEDGKGWLIRLYNTTSKIQHSSLSVSGSKPIQKSICLNPCEIKTYRVDMRKGRLTETSLMEEKQ